MKSMKRAFLLLAVVLLAVCATMAGIQPDLGKRNTVQYSQKNPTDGTLNIGRVITTKIPTSADASHRSVLVEPGPVIDFDGNIIGLIDSYGKVLGAGSAEIGTVRSDGFVYDKNNKRIGRNTGGETLFWNDDKVKYTQSEDLEIYDPAGNKIVYDQAGNIMCKITPNGNMICRSTAWDSLSERDKKLIAAGEVAKDLFTKSKKEDKTDKIQAVKGENETQTFKEEVISSDSRKVANTVSPDDLRNMNLDDKNGDWCICKPPSCVYNTYEDGRFSISFVCSKCRKVNVVYAKKALELEARAKAKGGNVQWFGPNAKERALNAGNSKSSRGGESK